MKKRTGSRSRSRSHSPAHNRERNYTREYQNNREFRGYNRGYRRPFYFRGRGRGFYPRGRFNRGGGGGGGGGYGNYRSNWQNYRPQQQHQQSPRRGRSRSRSPKRRSGSPRSRSRSRYSDRSSSAHSRRSRRSSSSDSRSSSRHSRSESSKRKTTKERKGSRGSVSTSKEAQGSSNKEETSTDSKNEKVLEMHSGGWQGLTSYDASPKRASPAVRSAVVVSQSASVSEHPSPSLQSVAIKRSSPGLKSSLSPSKSNTSAQSPVMRSTWQGSGISPSNKSPPEKSPSGPFSAFGFFSKDSNRTDDDPPVPTTFKKYLEDQKSKTLLQKWENGRDKEQKATELERDKKSDMASPSQRVAAYSSLKSEYCSKSEKGKYKQGNEFEKSSAAGFLEGSQTGSPDPSGEQEKRYKVRNQKEREYEDEPKYTSKITINTIKDHDIFDERWDELDYFPSSEEFRKDDDDDDYDIEDDLYRNRKDNRVTASAPAEVAAPSKKADPSAYRSLSPNEGPKSSRYKEKPGLSPPPSPPPVKKTSENREREKNVARKQDSPTETGPSSSGYREAEVNFKVNTFLEEYPSGSGVISSERLISRDLVHPSKKDQEFRSIFQHIETSQSRRSPSEVFAQHIVNIVHHVKARHFETSRMTLNERFGMYQRRAADKETSKQKKSPEIHRRIDVSPSAFMKHSHHYEEMKSSREDSYKEEGKKNKGNTVDLRLDIERRKKYPSKEQDSKREGLRDSEESHESSISRERSSEKPKKSHKASKKPKKHKKTRERSRSSSTSSSSSHSYKGGDFPEELKEKQEVFDKSRLGSRDYSGAERGRSRGGFQLRIRGRSWNRGNNSENNSNGNSTNVVTIKRSKEEEWDPEYTPKSKKYYLHDNREGEGEKKWLENRGRGRGTFQRGRGRFMFKKSGSTTSPKWAHDMFQGSGEEGELHDEDSEVDDKEEKKSSSTVAADI
ncbi:thyroid hormone receptor-associated protein 3 isoform X2 [Erpetoichthys calabaricus]|uniref:Thyroid hormone receptor associated protein 3 n=1 Tax=Erpetoichthys calabaricus TaxID=27687 RepID=A0A8C4T4R8_ERPCA|nr:thyroid hormone receptor-associated protein 3 isoform X2 [Erpetoichthys calabaricus]